MKTFTINNNKLFIATFATSSKWSDSIDIGRKQLNGDVEI